MRRRQGASEGAASGIFIIEWPDLADKHAKYHRHRRKKNCCGSGCGCACGSLLLTLFLVALAAISVPLMLKKKSGTTASPTLKSIVNHSNSGNDSIKNTLRARGHEQSAPEPSRTPQPDSYGRGSIVEHPVHQNEQSGQQLPAYADPIGEKRVDSAASGADVHLSQTASTVTVMKYDDLDDDTSSSPSEDEIDLVDIDNKFDSGSNAQVISEDTPKAEQSSSSMMADSAAKDVVVDSDTPEIGTTEPPRIPRRLIFTYSYNLLSPTVDDPPFDAEDPLTANVLNTIREYKKYWESMDAKVSASTQPREKVVVSFLTDADCLEAIAKSDSRLVKRFYLERKGEWKADLCRAAYLYQNGGYFFDLDIGVIEPVDLDDLPVPPATVDTLAMLRTMNQKNPRATPSKDDIITFSTVYGRPSGYYFFQGFTAATPRHPILKRSLEYMDAYYEGTLEKLIPDHVKENLHSKVIPSRSHSAGMPVGPYTLEVAYHSTTHEEWEEYVRELMEDRGYSGSQLHNQPLGEIPSKRRYSRFLYEISLAHKEVERLGLWKDIPRQDAEYQTKREFCNHVCFGGQRVYFYTWTPGSKACPREKKFD
mmetsp:Transcript_1365/g.2543  ORF Transcript_1365/g.2543 Transcript_1365/m.2543 type:complete len:593 (-) Transcript_1365:450-2228(-)